MVSDPNLTKREKATPLNPTTFVLFCTQTLLSCWLAFHGCKPRCIQRGCAPLSVALPQGMFWHVAIPFLGSSQSDFIVNQYGHEQKHSAFSWFNSPSPKECMLPSLWPVPKYVGTSPKGPELYPLTYAHTPNHSQTTHKIPEVVMK